MLGKSAAQNTRGLLRLLLALCLLAIGLAVVVRGQTKPAQGEDVIRTEIDLTNLLFTVTDRQHRFITTLQERDVRVLEDGVQQQLFTFQRETDRPLSVAILIDVSASEERTLPDEKAAARTFIENIIRSDKDQVAIIPFEGSAYLEQALTPNLITIYQALLRVDVAMPSYLGMGRPIEGLDTGPGVRSPRQGSTAIWDAIAVTAGEVLTRTTGQRRRAIILLTDGYDTSSRLLRSVAIDRAIGSETVIYAIGIGDSKYEGVNKRPLNEVAERTGGRAFFPKKEADLKAAFEQIEQELRSQYLLAYSSTNKKRDGAYRQMRIELASPELRKELKLRYRPGYFARPLPANIRNAPN